MESAHVDCVICNQDIHDKTVKFTTSTLDKSKLILKIRKQHNLKFNDISLPEEVNYNTGYHVKCYKNFIAVMKKYRRNEPSTSSNVTASLSEMFDVETEEISSSVDIEENEASTSGEASVSESSDDKLCIFCTNKYKRVKGRFQALHSSETESLMQALKAVGENNKFYEKVSNIASPIVYYHNSCRTIALYTLQQENEVIRSPKKTWKYYHQQAFEEMKMFITEEVINKKKCYSFTYLCKYYSELLKAILEENGENTDYTFSTQRLEDKLLRTFDDIKIVKKDRKNYLTLKNDTIDVKMCELLEEEEILQKAALILRQSVLNINKNNLPDDITTTHLINGECEIPKHVFDFYSFLLGGCKRRRRMSTNCIRKVNSLAYDLIYNVSNGLIKTKKHITLGMTLKSLTSSRKIVDIINKYGHCCSYHIVEELETAATTTSYNRSKICPEEICKRNDMHTGVAFDNFDRYVDTATGKDTLHDTVGIIYQTIIENDGSVEETAQQIESRSENNETLEEPFGQLANLQSKKRKRAFDVIISELVPYSKKPKMVDQLLPLSDNLRQEMSPASLQLIYKQNFLLMLCHSLKIQKTPMWIGFHHYLNKDLHSNTEKICYLTPINESPTNTSVVIETMKQSQNIAAELEQPYINVTYDLAIAKIAMQVQFTEKPAYDNLFIHLGPFHIMLALFKAIGKFIDDCGIMNIAVESEIIANGSVDGFLTGKHFNRCKRLHPLMALGLEILCFQSFLEKENIILDENVNNDLSDFIDNNESFENIIEDDKISTLMTQYQSYKEECRAGTFGKTPQFYTVYIELVNYYQLLSRSIRTGNFSLYKYVLSKIASIFFVTNQPNYSRWLVKYHDNLLKVGLTHPSIARSMEEGYLGIKRTAKSFSRQPIDLVLEQTINADAGKRLTGVIQFTNSISARQRWARSHDIRTTIISYTMDVTGLRRKNDVSADLEEYAIKRNSAQLWKFINTFEKFLNPFQLNLDDNCLYNIGNGTVASSAVQEYLLNFLKIGENLKDKFISECSTNGGRFEEKISQVKIMNFASEKKKKTIKVDNKVHKIRVQRDLFGRLLALSMQFNIDVEKTLSYPITIVPMSLCHEDGTIHKTAKSAMIEALQENTPNEEIPERFDAIIFDGFYLLHTMKNIPKTFGNISKKIMSILTATHAPRVDIIFDQYFSPSIKDYERSQRHEVRNIQYLITGPEQVRPVDFIKELRNIEFKEAFVDFLITHWSTSEMAEFIKNTTINLNYKKCHIYSVHNNCVISNINDNLSCQHHEEADTKIIYHICQMDDDVSNVLIKSSDTDILIIMLGNMDHLCNNNLKIYMEYGKMNLKKRINISQLHIKLGSLLCQSLPGFHALTGCDFNPCFLRRGKKKPYRLLQKNIRFQKAFAALGNAEITERKDEVFPIIENFVCQMYGMKSENLNEARYEKFLATYKTSSTKVFIKKVISYDASNLPPCQRELQQQLLRSLYITNIWQNSHLKVPTVLKPEDYGWNLIDGKYAFNWFEGNTVPSSIYDILLTQPTDTAENESSEAEEHIKDDEISSDESYDGDEESNDDLTDDDED